MSREGRLGFPRPFGDILSEYRPLIPSKFSDVPRNVAAVLTSLDDLYQTKSVDSREVQGVYFADVVLDIRGVDNFSKSSLAFDDTGEFIGGMIRAGSVVMNERQTRDRIGEEWRLLLEDGVNLSFEVDDIDTILREDIRAGEDNVLTPHVFFSTRRPVMDEEVSPLTTPEIIRVVQRIADSWDARFDNYAVAPRAGTTAGEEGTSTTNLGDNIKSLTDRI